jgi:hypothetical protein
MSDERFDPPFAEEDQAEAGPEAPNAADPVLQRRYRSRADRAKAEAAQFWAGIFASEVGRREMWSILTSASTFKKRFGTGPNGFPQSEATAYFDAERDFGQRLWLSWMAICPDGVAVMMKEHHPELQPPPKPRRRRRFANQADEFAEADRR